MVEQQRFIRLRQSAEAILKRKKPLLEEMVSKVHDHERKNMDVYVLHDSTLPRDLVIIFRRDKSGEYNNVSSPEIDRLRTKIQHCKEEIIRLQEQIYPRGTEDGLSPEEKYDRIHPKGYYKNEAATRRPTKLEHDINTTEFSVWDKPDTRTPFQKGDEPVLSDLKKAGVYVYPFSNCPVKWKTPTDVETPPERIHVTYCDHIENTEETSESDEGREN